MGPSAAGVVKFSDEGLRKLGEAAAEAAAVVQERRPDSDDSLGRPRIQRLQRRPYSLKAD